MQMASALLVLKLVHLAHIDYCIVLHICLRVAASLVWFGCCLNNIHHTPASIQLIPPECNATPASSIWALEKACI